MIGRMECSAVQTGSIMVCAECGLSWSVGNSNPPPCDPGPRPHGERTAQGEPVPTGTPSRGAPHGGEQLLPTIAAATHAYLTRRIEVLQARGDRTSALALVEVAAVLHVDARAHLLSPEDARRFAELEND